MGKGLAIGEIPAPLRNAAGDALGLIGRAVAGACGQRGALRDQACAEIGVARVGLGACGRGLRAPDGLHGQGLAEVAQLDLRAQAIEAQAFQQVGGQRRGDVEPEGVVLFGEDEIDDDLALRGQKRAKGGVSRGHALDIAGEKPLQKAARLGSADAQNASVIQKA